MEQTQTQSTTANRGFASMDPQLQKSIASKGGLSVSQNRAHMAEIGRKGGNAPKKVKGVKI